MPDPSPPVYLDNAATTFPKPPQVVEAIRTCLGESLTVQRSTHVAPFRGDAVMRRCRAKLARFFNALHPQEIVFTYSATDGLNIALHGLIPPGSHVLTTPLEHHSVMRPLQHMALRSGLTWDILPADEHGRVLPEAMRKLVKPNSSALVVNWISNVSGTVQPAAELGAIARELGLAYIVDAAQAAGSHAVDVQGLQCDAMALPGHKAMFSLPGTGVLYVRREADVQPWRIGGTGYRSDLVTQPEERPMRFESGTPNVPGIVGLDAAMDWFESVGGVEAVEERCGELTGRLVELLQAIPGVSLVGPPPVGAAHTRPAPPMGGAYEDRGHVVSFTVDNAAGEPIDPLVFSQILAEQYGISSRAGLHCAPTTHRFFGTYDRGGGVRFSMSWFTEDWMLERAAEAVRQIAEQF
jgi:cysteine desulfurase/selenocysteine lyase